MPVAAGPEPSEDGLPAVFLRFVVAFEEHPGTPLVVVGLRHDAFECGYQVFYFFPCAPHHIEPIHRDQQEVAVPVAQFRG